MSFPRRGRGGGSASATASVLASVPYERPVAVPPAQLYPPFRYTADAAQQQQQQQEGADHTAAASRQTDGVPQSLFPHVPLAPGTREKRAVEEQLLLRQRMRLSVFYMDRSAAQQPRKHRKSDNSQGVNAALVVMEEALPAARALVPAELLETGPVRHRSGGSSSKSGEHKPAKKRARHGDADIEGLFSNLEQQEQQEQQGEGDEEGEKKKRDEDDEDSNEEGSDLEGEEPDSDGDGGDYDMGQYGSDGDDYDYGGDDGGDGGDGDDYGDD